MSLSNEMKELSKQSRNENELISSYWEDAKVKIKAKASEGLNELCLYEVKGCLEAKTRDIMIKKLEDEGFRIMCGSQLGKGMRNSATLYIVW